MRVVKNRWAALAVGLLLLASISACQIEQSSGPASSLNYVKASPDLNLNAAPDGYIYELWLLVLSPTEDTTGEIPFEFTGQFPLTRFQWDPYLYAASDENGNYVPLTEGNGVEMNIDVGSYFQPEAIVIGFITVEPIADPTPEFPNGPTLLALNINPESHIGFLINPFALLEFFGRPQPSASYRLMSQSNKKGVPGAQWRDNETEGNGIWFCEPRLDDLLILDSAGGFNAYTQTFVDTVFGAYNYNVWVNRAHPESSFSTFGRVFLNREPDFEFQNGQRIHAPGRFGPGVALGQNPVFENGVVVGYRYVGPNGLDTCVVRIDNPALTRCNRDTFAVLNFTNTDVLPRSFTTTDGDTSLVPTLAGLVDLGDPEELAALPNGAGFLFAGWEYEAWLVFTEESGIPPLSLGRFKDPEEFDSGNPYTNAGFRFDSNFACPGEDFLVNLPGQIGSPLNVITDPRVEKIWITIEPDDNAETPFGPANLDWAPNEPNEQLIYLSQYIPKSLPNFDFAGRALVVRDINPSESGLNAGNFFPTVTIQFMPPPE